MSNNSSQAKWYQKRGLVWVALFFIPPIGLIMLFLDREKRPGWKKIAALGIIWTLVLAASSMSKHAPGSTNHPQTQATAPAAPASPPQQQPSTPTERTYNIGLTNAEFDSRFAETSKKMVGTRIDSSQGDFKPGEKRDVFTLRTKEGAVLQKWINKDKTLNAVLVIANLDQDGALVLTGYAGLVIMTVQPNISVDDCGILIDKLITPPNGEAEFTNKVANGDILYTLTCSRQTGLVFTASNKNE